MTTATGDYSLPFGTYGDQNPFSSAAFDKIIGGANGAKVESGLFKATSPHSADVIYAFNGTSQSYDGTDIVESKIEVGTAAQFDMLYCGVVDSIGYGYIARLDGTTLSVQATAAYVIGTGVGNTTETFADGDVLSVKCVKGAGSTTTVTVYKNGVSVAAVSGDRTEAGALTGTLYAVFGVQPGNTNASTIKSFALDGLEAAIAPTQVRTLTFSIKRAITEITPSGPAYASAAETYTAIITEAGKRYDDAGGRPLPLAATWNGPTKLSVQMADVAAGYPVIPTANYNKDQTTADFLTNADDLADISAAGLPITLYHVQYEYYFTQEAQYLTLPDADKPLTLTAPGTTNTYISPMGTDGAWETLATDVAESDVIAYLQTTGYVSPPKVILLSNNESLYCGYADVNTDIRFAAAYPGATIADQTNVYHYAMIDRWNAFFGAFDTALTSVTWQANSTHVGYNAFLPARYRTTSGAWGFVQWNNAVVSGDQDRLMWHPYAWQGGSPEVYDNHGQWQYDYADSRWPASCKAPFLMWSPQNEAMVNAFARDLAYSINPDYWFEVSIWDGEFWADADGFVNNAASQKAQDYATIGIDPSPDYYKGWVQYCMWACKPRALREFRYYDPRIHNDAAYRTYWQKILDMVAHVHSDATLRRFWRQGTIVENTTVIGSTPHPYQVTNDHAFLIEGSQWDTPNRTIAGTYYANTPQNFHLTTSVDADVPPGPYPLTIYSTSPIQNYFCPIYTMAHVIGTAPNREWLVYAHATGINTDGTTRNGAALTNVVVTIPGYQDVTLPTVSVSGNFYYIQE